MKTGTSHIIRGLLLVLLVIAGNTLLWVGLNRPLKEQAWRGLIASMSFTPYREGEDPLKGIHPSKAEIDADLKTVSKYTRNVRTYSTVNGHEFIPELARKHDLTVTMGAWIQGYSWENEQEKGDAFYQDKLEIKNLIQQVRDNPNITRAVVGNEALLREDVTVRQLIDYIKEVKAATNIPVSTAEVFGIILNERQLPDGTVVDNNPEIRELIDTMDYIAVHILPFWEGKTIDESIDYVFEQYERLKKKYPNKTIVISEVGWPSAGQWFQGAQPSANNQAKFIRTFLNRARAENVDYTIMEAFDQPWKWQLEGPVGRSWGLFDAQRRLKFDFQSDAVSLTPWKELCAAATLLALPFMLWFALRKRSIRGGGILFFTILIQVVATLIVLTIYQIMQEAYRPAVGVAWSFLVIPQLLLLAVILTDGFEFAELLWKRQWRRPNQPIYDDRPDSMYPKVSIHVPCYNEPPEMVIETLDALARLDYPNFEVIIIDNNTKDEAVWRPLEAHCASLGERFRFFHVAPLKGFKAGALNWVLERTADDAAIIAVIDSDYCVTPDWLKRMVPHFDNPKVGLVQSPQDYRDWQDNSFQRMIYWEYAGFFNIGMVTRNDRNAIIQHGTMTMVRKDALQAHQGWAEWCITEDAELGLGLFEQGWEAVYAPDSFGKGLVPDSFAAFKTQRHRWAYGSVQIIKKHWRDLFTASPRLTDGQRYHFLSGWLPWFADAVALIFVVGGILWTSTLFLEPITDGIKAALLWVGHSLCHGGTGGICIEAGGNLGIFPNWLTPLTRWFETRGFSNFSFPPQALMIPTICAFVFKLAIGFILYAARIKCGWKDRIGAAIAGMSLSHTVGIAMWQGVFTSGRPFVRTPKCEDKPAFIQGLLMAGSEVKLMLCLWIAAGLVLWGYTPDNRSALLWASTMVIQSLPYLSALIVSMINALPALKASKKQ